METAQTWTGLLEKLSSFFGRQPLPPKWLNNGAVLGLQGGTEKVNIFKSTRQKLIFDRYNKTNTKDNTFC